MQKSNACKILSWARSRLRLCHGLWSRADTMGLLKVKQNLQHHEQHDNFDQQFEEPPTMHPRHLRFGQRCNVHQPLLLDPVNQVLQHPFAVVLGPHNSNSATVGKENAQKLGPRAHRQVDQSSPTGPSEHLEELLAQRPVMFVRVGNYLALINRNVHATIIRSIFGHLTVSRNVLHALVGEG